MSDKYAALRAAAQEEIMCRESGDTSDAWREEANPERIIELLGHLQDMVQLARKQNRISCELFDESTHQRQRILDLLAEGNADKARIAELAAENAALKSAFKPEVIPEEAVNAFMDTAIIDHDWNDTGEWSWVDNETDVIRAVLDALVKPETPATDAWQREQMAKGVEKFAGSLKSAGFHHHPYSAVAIDFAAQLRNGEAV